MQLLQPTNDPSGGKLNAFARTGSDRLLVVGHRGAEALAPENTWAALKAGYQAGADILEIDIQLTRDGEAIVYHDFSLQPKLGDSRWVRDLNWVELQDLDVGSWFHPDFCGERIPRLAEVLDWARDRVALWVDLKHGFVAPDDDRLEMAALSLIEAAGMMDKVLISSWDQVALARIHAHCPEIPLAVNLPQRVQDPIEYVKRAGAQWLAAFWPQADRQMIAELRAAGIVVALVNIFSGDYTEALRLGADVVSAKDPGAARIMLEQAVL
jgi:glycerophosphoryl diester phosphodiesterase